MIMFKLGVIYCITYKYFRDGRCPCNTVLSINPIRIKGGGGKFALSILKASHVKSNNDNALKLFNLSSFVF